MMREHPSPLRRWLAVIPALVLAGGLVAVALWAMRSNTPSSKAAAATTAAQGDSASRAAAARKATDAATAALVNQDIATAQTILEGALVELPADQSLRFLYAEVLAMKGDYAGAYEQVDHAIPLGPDLGAHRHTAAMYANRAGMPEHAETHLLMAQKLDPGNPQYPLHLGLIQYKLANLTEAKKNLLIAVRVSPDSAEAWATLAQIALDEDHAAIGLQHIAKARTIAPDLWQLRLTEARLLRREGQPREAAQLLLDLPDDILLTNDIALEDAATSLGMMGDPVRAAALYIDAAERRPNHPDLDYWAAFWLDRAGDPARAHEYARRAAAGTSLREDLRPLAANLLARLAEAPDR